MFTSDYYDDISVCNLTKQILGNSIFITFINNCCVTATNCENSGLLLLNTSCGSDDIVAR